MSINFGCVNDKVNKIDDNPINEVATLSRLKMNISHIKGITLDYHAF